MKREIKFRAWDTFNERMIYDPYYFRKNQEPKNDDERFNTPMQYAEKWMDVEDGIWRPCHIMQLTGVKDKNGKEIWEGDLIRVSYGKGIVEYSDIQGMFIIAWTEDKEANNESLSYEPRMYNFGRTRTDLEVIGNIYEKENN